MPKRKAAQSDNIKNDSAKEKLAKEKKEGGPLERQRSFMRQRAAVLRPRENSAQNEEDKSAPEPPSPRPGKKRS